MRPALAGARAEAPGTDMKIDVPPALRDFTGSFFSHIREHCIILYRSGSPEADSPALPRTDGRPTWIRKMSNTSAPC